jgi:hypothetical protein
MMQLVFRLITPERAEELLKLRKRNNPIKRVKLERYKKMMLEGRWKNKIGTPVLIRKGELLDGHHRLSAVVETGKSYIMMIRTDDTSI